MKLIAKKSLIYSGKRIKTGEEFAAERRFGTLFIAIGKAKLAPVKEPEPIKEPEPPKPKRVYRRKDMIAENESEG